MKENTVFRAVAGWLSVALLTLVGGATQALLTLKHTGYLPYPWETTLGVASMGMMVVGLMGLCVTLLIFAFRGKL